MAVMSLIIVNTLIRAIVNAVILYLNCKYYIEMIKLFCECKPYFMIVECEHIRCSGRCVPFFQMCDGVRHCANGEDERNCCTFNYLVLEIITYFRTFLTLEEYSMICCSPAKCCYMSFHSFHSFITIYKAHCQQCRIRGAGGSLSASLSYP